MKKYVSFLLVFAAVTIGLQGCLKDKGFDNNEYGIKDPSGTVAISIPQAVEGITILGVDFINTSQTFKPVVLQLETSNPADRDLHANLVLNSTLVSDYNTANGTTFIVLPASAYSIPNLKVTILKGHKIDSLSMIIPNASSLNPLVTYALGVTLASVDETGVSIPDNMKNVVIQFSIKNKYDGKYMLKGQFYHPTSAPTYPMYSTSLIEMITTGPNSVKMSSKVPGLNGYYHPWVQVTGGAFTAFSGQEPEYTINPTTNAVTVQNTAAGAVTFYTMGKGYNNAGYSNRYDPATKTIYACFGYNMSGSDFVSTTTRMWIDTLIRTGPR